MSQTESRLRSSGRTLGTAQIGQPSTTVELAVGGLDLVGLEAVGGGLDDQRVEALHLLRAREGHPSYDHRVTGMPGVDDREGHVGLRALAREEGRFTCESESAELSVRGERSQQFGSSQAMAGNGICQKSEGVNWQQQDGKVGRRLKSRTGS